MSVWVPVPILINEPRPDITPLNVVFVLSVPTVNDEPVPTVTEAPPASEPIVLLKAPKAKVPPLTVTALFTPNAAETTAPLFSTVATPACNVPAVTVVLPV